jgi:hypothetical protein
VTIKVEEDLTIVCASHNGVNRIPLFLDSIQKNIVNPKEVIICGTHESDISSVSEELLIKNNVSFIVSEFANQIYQRNIALSKVNTTYILQLDDDLILDSNVIGNYCRHFSGPGSNKKVVCGFPVLPNGQHMSFYRVKNLYQSSKFIRLFFKIMNGFEELRNMSILKSGRIFPLVLDDQENIEPEWLHSCLMFHKDAIGKKPITSSENNNGGKGYYEDVFFTLSLREKGFKLILDEDIRMTHPYTSSIKPRDYINTIYRQKKLLERTGGSYLLFYLDVVASCCFYTILHIKSKLLN